MSKSNSKGKRFGTPLTWGCLCICFRQLNRDR